MDIIFGVYSSYDSDQMFSGNLQPYTGMNHEIALKP